MSNTANINRFTRVGATRESELEQFPIIKDERTQLLWDRRETKELNYAGALAHVAKLNADKFGGRDDWRLPTHDELRSLVDLTKHRPAIDTDAFPLCKSSWYQSSTPAAESPEDSAWVVNFFDGYSLILRRDSSAFVRACCPSQ